MKRRMIALIFVFMIIFSLNVLAYDRFRFKGGNGNIVELYDLDEIESSRIKVYGNIKVKGGECFGYFAMRIKAADVNGKKIDFRLKLKPRGKDCDLNGTSLILSDDADIFYETRNNGERSIVDTDSRGYFQYGKTGRENAEKFDLEEGITVNADLNNGLLDIYNGDFRIENIEI